MWIKYQLNTLWRRFFNRRKFVIPIVEQVVNQIPYEDSIIINNKWGEYKVKGKWKYFQGLFSKGWKFLAPVRNFGVIGYPCIRKSFEPLKVEDLDKLVLDYDFSINIKNGIKYNLTADIWLFNTPTFEWKGVRAEVMVWEDFVIAKPDGNFKGIYKDSLGNSYKLYSGWMDKTDEEVQSDGWWIFSFIRERKTNSGVVDIKSLIQQIPSEFHNCNIDRVEMGTEVFNSDGEVTINHFKVWE